jgi:hypothetical protein
MAFILRKIALAMRLIQDPPLFRRKFHRALQALKYDEPIFGSIAVSAQCGERKRVSRVIGQIKAAIQAQCF